MHFCMSFLEEGSGGSLSQENLDGSDGTTIPKLTLNLDDKKRKSYDEDENNVPTEKYPDVDEGKDDGQNDDDEASGDEDASTKAGPNESEEEENGDGTAASSYHEPEPEPEPDLSSIKPDQGYSEIGVWDNKVGEGGSETVRENELDNVMEKLKEVYDMIHNVIKKWDNSDINVEPLFQQKFVEPSGEEENETNSVNEEEGNTSTEVTTKVGNEKEPLSYTSQSPTEYNTNTDEATTEKKKRRKRQKKKRRHRRIRRIRRRQ